MTKDVKPTTTTTSTEAPQELNCVTKAIRDEYIARGLNTTGVDFNDVERRISYGIEDFTPEEDEAIAAAFDKLIAEAEASRA